MGLSDIKPIDLENEEKCIKELFDYSDSFSSVVFNSGAGSGKTYALIQCLKHIVSIHYDDLKNHNQKICCITYTNVAAEHIKKQLGISDVVDVSTIHERIWNIISNQKSALLKLHETKLKMEIDEIDSELLNEPKYEKYRKLDSSSQTRFFKLMSDNKKIYNKAYNCAAGEFKKAMPQEISSNYSDLLSSVSNFKNLVDIIFKRERYVDCLNKIKDGVKDYKIVNYNAMYNRDRLEKMRISHDTLLEYGYELIKNYPRMRQLIIDKYPYILIDEYQDTAENVVKIMNYVQQYARQIKHNVFIAYFGDSAQNIYDTGVGGKLAQLHSGLNYIYKEYNRRSYSEVIEISNRVRKDKIVQKSIYSDCSGGDVKFYYGSSSNVNQFINKCVEKWNVDIEHPLHCMFATNEMVAEYSGFLNLYRALKNADIYKRQGHKQLTSDLLSRDIVHLGKVQSLLYRLIKLYIQVRDEKQPLRYIFPTEEYRNMSFPDLKSLIVKLQSINGDTLDELLVSIFKEYDVCYNQVYGIVMKNIFDIDDELSYDKVLKFILVSLYKSWDENSATKKIIHELLEVKIEELLNWFHYINRDEGKEIYYHTFHSTKGMEYNNVVIILGKDFGRNKNLFENYFKNYGVEDKIADKEYEKARNILYVSISRAIKNLRILYVDDVNQIRKGLVEILGDIYEFSDNLNIDNF